MFTLEDRKTWGAVAAALRESFDKATKARPLFLFGPDARAAKENRSALSDYLVAQYGARDREVFSVIFLDREGRYIALEEISQGSHESVAPDFRRFAAKAIEHDACAFVMLHNHPSGNATPSDADVKFTGHWAAWSQPLGLTLVDHIVVAAGGVTSIKMHSATARGPKTAARVAAECWDSGAERHAVNKRAAQRARRRAQRIAAWIDASPEDWAATLAARRRARWAAGVILCGYAAIIGVSVGLAALAAVRGVL